MNKNVQLKFCKIFGYNYDWIQNNKQNIFYQWPGFQDRWYKNVVPFVQDLIINFYLDETVESFGLSFLCCDRNVVNNIISGITPPEEEHITPIAIVNKSINGIKVRTFHRFESNNINYTKCRDHFVVLIKMILMLRRQDIIDFPYGYLITPQEHDMIRDGSMHLIELFNKHPLSSDFYLDDLEDKELYSLLPDAKTINKPNIFHALNKSILYDILSWSGTSSSIILTDDLASKFKMDKKALIKYLKLFDKNNTKPSSEGIFIHSGNTDRVLINLVRIRELHLELNNHKILDTAFG